MNSSIAIFKTHSEAEAAIKTIQNSGFDMKKLSIVSNDVNSKEQVLEYCNFDERIKYWGKRAVIFGALWGLFFVTAFFLVPGMIAELEPSLVVGGIGALGAGFCSIRVPSYSATDYERSIKARKFALIADGTEEDIKTVHDIFRNRKRSS